MLKLGDELGDRTVRRGDRIREPGDRGFSRVELVEQPCSLVIAPTRLEQLAYPCDHVVNQVLGEDLAKRA